MSTEPAAVTARKLTYNPKERLARFRALSLPEQSAVFAALSAYVQQALLEQLRLHEIVDILDHLDMRQAEAVLMRMRNAKRRERIIACLKGDIKEKMDYFLRFHPKATISLINFDYLYLSADATIAEAAAAIDEYYDEIGKFPEVLVHAEGELLGDVPLTALVQERRTTKLARLARPVVTITYYAEVADIIDTLATEAVKKVVVLDHDASVLGVIYADAARTLFGNAPAHALYDFAGVDDSERPFDSVGKKVRNRYKWLILNLATCFLAGSVVLVFQSTIDALTILSVYIPIIAGMGSNAATQTFAIMVRGLTLGTVSLKQAGPVIRRELAAGLINGMIIGAIVALVSTVWNGQGWIGLVVAVALVGSHAVAAITGAYVPLLMKHIGRDPAATSTIFITTATDVFGLLFLLGLATLFLV